MAPGPSYEELAAHFGPEEFLDPPTAGERWCVFACRFDIETKVQTWAAPPFQSHPFAECCKIKSYCIKAVPQYRTDLYRPLQMALMNDQLKPDCPTRPNNDVLRLIAQTLYGIAASGHVEDGVSKIIR